MKKPALLLLFLLTGFSLFSHSVEYSVVSTRTYLLEVKMGTGEPLPRAEVLVFPPEETEYEYKLNTDDAGRFSFAPDREGTWILQVRGEGGHGLRINLPVDDSPVGGGSALTPAQKVIMVLCVFWGALGTALYFQGRKKN